jgi:hypothetical protein
MPNSAAAAAMSRASAAAAAGAADSKWLAPSFQPPISSYVLQKKAEPPMPPQTAVQTHQEAPWIAATAIPARSDAVAAASEQRHAHDNTGADHIQIMDQSAVKRGEKHSFGLMGEEHTDYGHEQRHSHRATGQDHLGLRITDASTNKGGTSFGIMGEEHTDYAHEQRHLHNSFGKDHLGAGCAFSAPFGTDLNNQTSSELFTTVAGRGGQFDSNLLRSVGGVSRQKHAVFHQESHFEQGKALLPQEVADDPHQGISKKMHVKFHQKSHFHGTMLQRDNAKQTSYNRSKAAVPNKTYSSQIRLDLMDNQHPGVAESADDDPYGQRGGVKRLSYKNGSQVALHPYSAPQSPNSNGGRKHYRSGPAIQHNDVWAWGVPPAQSPDQRGKGKRTNGPSTDHIYFADNAVGSAPSRKNCRGTVPRGSLRKNFGGGAPYGISYNGSQPQRHQHLVDGSYDHVAAQHMLLDTDPRPQQQPQQQQQPPPQQQPPTTHSYDHLAAQHMLEINEPQLEPQPEESRTHVRPGLTKMYGGAPPFHLSEQAHASIGTPGIRHSLDNNFGGNVFILGEIFIPSTH